MDTMAVWQSPFKQALAAERARLMVSLAPHCYLFSLFAVTDRIDLYLWLRLVVMNVLFLVALVWQKRATASWCMIPPKKGTIIAT